MLSDPVNSNWLDIKELLYFEDGSLRDILILNTTINDWVKWAEYVNSNYPVTFVDNNTNVISAQIDISSVQKYWQGELECLFSASIIVGSANVNTYFFDGAEIEFDICPKEFRTITTHQALISYMKDVSKILDKPVILSDENSKENILVKVEWDDHSTKS